MALSPAEILARLKQANLITDEESGGLLSSQQLSAEQSVIREAIEIHNQFGFTEPNQVITANFAFARIVCGPQAPEHQVLDLVSQFSREALALLAPSRNS